MDVRLVAQTFDQLGEGPVWAAAEGRLYWFDIKGRKLHWHEPATGAVGGFGLPLRATAAAPRQAGGLLVATERGLAHLDPQSQALEIIEPLALEPGFRTNDGKIGVDGAFWWSTMDDNGGERPGVVYRTEPGRPSEAVIEGIHIANTVSTSPDGRLFYLADSRAAALYAYEVADLSQRRLLAETGSEGCTPDGSAVDAEGFIWNCQWGGWRILRYAPDGRIDRIVRLPVEQPTSCAFGGEGLQTLYVTSAWDELTPEQREAQPLAGALFAFEPGQRGLPLPAFAG